MQSKAPLTDTKTAKTEHLVTLDGLRGLAALAVLWYHICELLQIRIALPHVHMAVDFFFMLSGYVVAKAYEAKLNGSMTFPHFVLVRLGRLYPMIFITVLMGTFLLSVRLMTVHDLTLTQILIATVCGLFLLPTSVLFDLYPDDLYPINGALWSLFFELAVNFAYAPITRWLTNKRLMILIIASGIGMCFITPRFHGVGVGWGATSFFYGFDRTIYPFTIGVMLFRFAPAKRASNAMTLFLSAVLLAALFAPVYENNWIYEMSLLTFVFPSLVYFGATCVNGTLLNKTCLTLGALSYPVYLVHPSAIRMVTNAVKIVHINMPVMMVAALAFIIPIIVSALLLKIWDEPIRRWLTGKRKKRAEIKAAVYKV